jgi:Transcription factor WhiB
VTIARGICLGLCPQLRACREWALGPGNSQLPGIVGGMTEDERRAVRRNRKQAASG